MNKKFTVKHIVAIGIGAAVFFILKRFVTIPTGVPNTDIATAYPFLALLGVVYGPVVAGLAGFIGHALGDLTTYGAWWAWIIASGILGVFFGLLTKRIPIEVFTQGIVAGITNAIVTGIIGIILLKAYAQTKVKKGSLNKEA